MGRILFEANLAYLAGLFDGDGAIMAWIETHREKKFGFRVRVVIKITQKHSEFLQELQEELGVGRVIQNRNAYELIIKDQKHILTLLIQFKKYLRIKRKQAEIALQILEYEIISKEDLLVVAELADTLASFNVRSKSRRKNFVSKIQGSVPPND